MNLSQIGIQEYISLQEKRDSEFFKLKTSYYTQYYKLSNNEIIGFRETGSGPVTILLIHGHVTCSINMEPLMKQLAPFARVVAPCLRGQGYSSYKKKISGLKDLAEDLKLFMEECIQVKTFYIIGHSMGGAIALQLSLLMPQQTIGVSVINSLLPNGIQTKNKVTMSSLKNNKYKADLYEMAQDLDHKKHLKFYQSFNMQVEDTNKLRENLMVLKRQRSYWECELAQYQIDIKEQLQKVNCQVQIMYGSDDIFHTIEDGLEIQLELKRAKLVALPDCSHFPHIEKPEIVQQKAMIFIKNCQKEFESIQQIQEEKQPQIMKEQLQAKFSHLQLKQRRNQHFYFGCRNDRDGTYEALRKSAFLY